MSEKQLADLTRDLQKKIAKARPLVEQHASGELKVLTDSEQRLIASYPRWVEDLEMVKRGEIPPKPEPAQAKHAPIERTQEAQESSPSPVTRPPPQEHKKREPKARSEGRKSSHKEVVDTPQTKHSKMIQQIRTADRQTRKGLIDTYVNAKVDKSKLAALTKEYDSICQLRRDVLSGRIPNPTKMQNSRIGLADQLKKEMSLEKERLKLQTDRERITLLCEVGDEDEEEDDQVEEEVVEAEDEQPEAAETNESEESASVKSEAQSENCTPNGDHLDDANESTHEENAQREETPNDDSDEAKAPPQVNEEPEASAAVPELDSTPAIVEENEPSEEEEEPAPERAKTPSPPPPPPPPKEIDWSEITIQKNRPRLTQQAAPSDSDATGSPTSPGPVEKVDPTAITVLEIGKPKLQVKSEPAKPKQVSKGKGEKAKVPQPSRTPLQQNVVQRVQKDYKECQANMLETVRFHIVNDDILLWHINVCPKDGPLAGCFVHLEMKFGDLYPMEPPIVRSLTEIPHPSIGTQESVRHVLCMEHTASVGPGLLSPVRGWSSAYTAFSVLTQLQTFFCAEAFAEAKRALGSSFKHRVLLARGDLSRLKCECGHTAASPRPAMACFNGPLEHPPQGMVVSDGAIRVVGRAPMGHHWVHGYTKSGQHHFRATIESPGEGLLIGLSTGRYNGPLEQIGKNPQSIAIDTSNGQLRNCGIVEDYEGPIAFPLKAFDVINVVVDLDAKVIRFEAGSDGKQLIGQVDDIDPIDIWHPSFALLSSESAVSLELVVDEASNWQFDPPVDTKHAVQGAAEDIRCFVTLATPQEAIIGVGLEVSRPKKDSFPTAICSTMEFISKEAADKQKHSAWGRKFDVWMPLMLDEQHTSKALPLLKKSISNACRNPNATAFYEPPFRPENAVRVLALALHGVVEEHVRHSKHSNLVDAFEKYTRFLQCLVVLAADNSSIIEKAQSVSDGAPSGTVFALAPICMSVPWPQQVLRALRAEARELKVTGSVTDDQLFAALKPKIKPFLVAATFSHAVTVTSLKKAQELFSSTKGMPTAEMTQEVENVGGSIGVTSWDNMCTFLRVNLAASDVVE